MDLDEKVRRHKLLLTTISDELDPSDSEYDNFIEHFKGYVRRGQLSSKRNLLGKLEALATRGYLGPGRYDVLKKISADSGNNRILELIEEAEEDIRQLDNTTTARNAHSSTSAGSSGLVTSGQKNNTDLDGSDKLSRYEGDRSYYDNTGKKGLLLILNFTQDRDGTELDVKKLKTFFGPDGLNFEIYDPRNYEQDDLTKSQVDVALEDIQHKLNEKEYKRYYCFVCVILSHGDEVGIKTRDAIKPIDEIQRSFNNKHVPNFAGRPKLFFIQACRGRADQRGHDVDTADDEVTPNTAEINYEDEADEIVYIPTDADTLTAYATTIGYRSFRRKGIGSWFITECMDVFDDYHHKDHVEEMLITVRQKVALGWEKMDGTKQMPCVNSTLTRRLMLTKSE